MFDKYIRGNILSENKIEVTVKYLGYFRTLTGKAEESIEINQDGTIKDVVELICGIHGDKLRNVFYKDGKMKVSNALPSFMVSGRGTSDVSKKLNDGETVAILNPIAGGS